MVLALPWTNMPPDQPQSLFLVDLKKMVNMLLIQISLSMSLLLRSHLL